MQRLWRIVLGIMLAACMNHQFDIWDFGQLPAATEKMSGESYDQDNTSSQLRQDSPNLRVPVLDKKALQACEDRHENATRRLRNIILPQQLLGRQAKKLAAKIGREQREKMMQVALQHPTLSQVVPFAVKKKGFTNPHHVAGYSFTWARWLMRDINDEGYATGLSGQICNPDFPLQRLPDSQKVARVCRDSANTGVIDMGAAMDAFDTAVVDSFMYPLVADVPAYQWDTSFVFDRNMSTLLYFIRTRRPVLVNFIAEFGARVDFIDHSGRSVLHHLALSNMDAPNRLQRALDKLPSSRRAALGMQDKWGYTPEDIISELQHPVRTLTPSPPVLQGSGGWKDLHSFVQEGWWPQKGCGIDEIDAAKMGDALESWLWQPRYVSLRRPVLLRNAMPEKHPLRKLLQRKTLQTRFGDLRFSVGSVPYAETHRGARFRQNFDMTLNQFLKDKLDLTGSYIFEALSHSDNLSPLLRAVRKTIPFPFNQQQMPEGGVQVQLFIGGAGTGSPFHQHHDAINFAAYGKKLWFLYPMGEGFSVADPVIPWLIDKEHSGGGPHGRAQPIRCVQHAGDALYVPYGWSHAVLNLEVSVGVAVEIIREDTMADMWPYL